MDKQKKTHFSKLFKISLYAVGTLTALLIIAISAGYFFLRGSLPQLAGNAKVTGLTAPVVIERDSLGIPTIRGKNRLDVSRALGFLHAQDRFFQMDLMRRASAGELSELFGKAAINIDKKRRLHQFRKRSKQIYENLSIEEKENLQAYTEGVNCGIDALSVRPFEYLFLRQQPKHWQPEDTLLVSFGLFFELQEDAGLPDLARGYMKSLLPESVYHFFVDNGSTWEAALDGSHKSILPIPPSEDFSYLKTYDKQQMPQSEISDILRLGGSNNWAITGNRTADGKPIIACDMHLKLAVPNIWYRATFIYPDSNGNEAQIFGATLPGAHCMIIGSNKHIAWGWTNAYLDTTDLVVVKFNPGDTNRYLTPQGDVELEREIEFINVKGEDPIPFEIQKTIWGPISPNKFYDDAMAIQWIAHLTESLNVRLTILENSNTVEEALQNIQKVRIPLLNFVVVDNNGHIGWTIAGIIPKRIGFDGTVPVSYADGSCKWEGYQDVKDHPVIYDPPQNCIWTANNRIVNNNWKIPVNQEGYLNGIRAFQIRDKLQNAENCTSQDMLTLQLNTEGLFFERWQSLLLTVLKEHLDMPEIAKLHEVVINWNKHSSPDSASYYWIRRFREITLQHLLARFLHPCFDAWSDFSHTSRDFEEPVWMLVSQKPDYLINPVFGSWENELLAYVEEMLEKDLSTSNTIDTVTWGRKTVLQMQHPFSKVIPALQPFLDMPKQSLPGDYYMPRLAGPQAGASQRMIVSPGNEEKGIYHSPGGQCGHPLSPHYCDCHEAWVNGTPTPFLPGKTVHTLVLK